MRSTEEWVKVSERPDARSQFQASLQPGWAAKAHPEDGLPALGLWPRRMY